MQALNGMMVPPPPWPPNSRLPCNMFQTEQRIRERASVGALPRFEYLQALVTEFQDAASTPAAQRQVLASLANFAYDPVNFGHLHALNVAELFLDMCSDASEDCVLLAVRGVCNCCPGALLRLVHGCVCCAATSRACAM